jgi:hypothetical protein
LNHEDSGATFPLADHWSTRGDASGRRAPGGRSIRPPLHWGCPMAEQQTATCPECSRTISPEDTVVFGFGIVGHLDCRRPRILSAEERTLLFIYCRDHPVAECVHCAGKFHLREVASIDQFGIRSHGCPWCHVELTDSIRAHLYGCAMLPVAVRRRAQTAREAAGSLVKESHQLRDGLRTCCCERLKMRSTRSGRPCASRRSAALADRAADRPTNAGRRGSERLRRRPLASQAPGSP